MTVSALLLVVCASVIHASWNLLAKRGASVGPVFVLAYSAIAVIVYAPWVAYLLVQGRIAWTWTAIGIVLFSSVIHLAYNLCLQRGYQVADLSVVYPVARGSGPMLATIGAFVILGERPSATGLLGLALVVTGILMIATRGRLNAFARPEGLAGVRWGGATGGLIASYTVVDAYAVKVLGIAPVVLDWFTNLVRSVVLLPLVLSNPRRAFAAMQGHWPRAIGIGILSPLSYILVLAALSGGAPLSLVAPMREMSMMIGALFGMLILGEKVGPWQLVGCAVLILGVINLSAS